MHRSKPLSLVVAVAIFAAALGGCAALPPAAEPRWEDAIRAFEAADAESPPPTGANLFLGSSSIRLWELGADFEGYPVLRRGFGGSRIADSILHAHRIVIPYRPRVIVFYAGDNDIAGGLSPERVRDDFRDLVVLLRPFLPETRIAFIAIKPSIARWHLAGDMRLANDLIRAFADGEPLVDFVDVWPGMLGEDGTPRAELLAPDGLHLSRDGYRVWADLVRPYLAR